MASVKISLSREYGGDLAVPAISLGEEQIEFAGRKSPSAACTATAKKLRLLADKFDELAKDPRPFSAATQRKINK